MFWNRPEPVADPRASAEPPPLPPSATRARLSSLLTWRRLAALLTVKLVLASSFAWDYGLRKRDMLIQAFFAYLSCAALIALLRLLGGKRQFVSFVLLDAVLSLLLLGDVLHVGQFGTPMSASMLSYAHQLVPVASAVTDLVEPRYLLLFADLPVLLSVLLYAGTPPSLFAPISPRRAAAVVLLAAGCTGVATRVEGVSPGFSNGYVGVVWRFGMLDYHLFDIAKFGYDAARRRAVPTERKQRIVEQLVARRREMGSGSLHGTAPHANVIVIQVESLQGFVPGMRVGGVSVAPNLEALAKESLVAKSFFHQTGAGRSADADLLLNCSLYPAPKGAAYFTYEQNHYHCLSRVLAAAGYQTASYQSTWGDLWNTARMHRRLGFTTVESLESFTRDDMLGIGLSDASFLRQTLERLTHLREPFFAYLVTLTSHVPYEYGESLPLGSLAGTRLGRYLEAIKYTDTQLGVFIEGLRARGLLDRTILVIYGDHDGVQWSPELQATLHLPDDEVSRFLAVRNIPLIVRFPEGRNAGATDEPLGQLDLAPAIAGALGVPFDDTLFLGREPGSPSHAAVVFPQGEVIDRTRLYVPPRAPGETGRCWMLATHADVGAERCADLATRGEQDLEASSLVFEYDLDACGYARGECGTKAEQLAGHR